MSEPKKGMSKGCLITLIVASVILVLVVAMSVVCYVKRDAILEWSMAKMVDTAQTDILNDLPEGYTADDVNKICDDFKTALKEKKVHADEVRNLATMFQDVLKDKKIDKDEAKTFLEELKRATGTPADESPAEQTAPAEPSTE
ncbi:hypothetical protein TRIP_C30113 [Candidatus Zixiibacteriota bacterium]|nr:hypothetical protein TRIP_C30113 [candidate division Zixibacteria bacterium]